MILRCALELFADRGYDAVGVQEVVEAAGITKPTLYYYFGSKLGLLKTLVETHHGILITSLEQAIDYHGDLPLTLERAAGAFFQFARENPIYYRLQMALGYSPRGSDAWQVISAWHNRQHELFEDLFEKAAVQHGNMRGRQKQYAAVFNGLLNTSIGLWLNGKAELDDRLLKSAVRQFQYGIYS